VEPSENLGLGLTVKLGFVFGFGKVLADSSWWHG